TMDRSLTGLSAAARAASRAGNVSPPRPSAPILKNSRRLYPWQSRAKPVSKSVSMPSAPLCLRTANQPVVNLPETVQTEKRLHNHRPDGAAQVAGFVLTTSLGNHAHDRLGIAGPYMYPAVFPVEAQAIEFVRPCLRPAIL